MKRVSGREREKEWVRERVCEWEWVSANSSSIYFNIFFTFFYHIQLKRSFISIFFIKNQQKGAERTIKNTSRLYCRCTPPPPPPPAPRRSLFCNNFFSMARGACLRFITGEHFEWVRPPSVFLAILRSFCRFVLSRTFWRLFTYRENKR